MALIGKIREKSGLLVVLIGIALFAFILGDWRKMTQGSEDQYGYGTNFPFVNGTHYVRTNINFYLRNERYYTNKQDGVTNFNNRKNINC